MRWKTGTCLILAVAAALFTVVSFPLFTYCFADVTSLNMGYVSGLLLGFCDCALWTTLIACVMGED
jgi:hypothetical protein